MWRQKSRLLESYWTKRKAYQIKKGLMGKGVEKGVENLSVNEKTLYHLIQKLSQISKGEMAKKGNLTKKTVECNLVKLKN
jgi:hypothetical protein